MQAWKIKRELHRVWLQTQGIFQRLYEPFLRLRHDNARPRNLKVRSGLVEVRRKIALLLIYQPRGLMESTSHTCQHLTAQGYAVLLVSNSPLSDDESSGLLPFCWRLMVRPNFGYDFGGYRDGIWWLTSQALDIERLLVINDSIWFPILDSSSIIPEMEAVHADVVGAVELGIPPPSEPSHRAGRAFLGSYFWLLNQRVLQHNAFRVFWQTYKATNNKHLTVRRGERGFSLAMRAAGLTLASIFDRTKLDNYLAGLSAMELLTVLNGLCEVDAKVEETRRQLCLHFRDDESWLRQAKQLTKKITKTQNVFASAPIICLTQFGVPYVKKAKTPQNIKALLKILAAKDAGQIVLNRVVESEIRLTISNARLNSRELYLAKVDGLKAFDS